MTNHERAEFIERVLRGVQRPSLRQRELSGEVMAAIDGIVVRNHAMGGSEITKRMACVEWLEAFLDNLMFGQKD
jgi:hypothetical protein